MAAIAITLRYQPLSSRRMLFPYSFISSHVSTTTVPQVRRCSKCSPLLRNKEVRNSIHESRANARSGMFMGDEDDDDDEDEEDRSLDLLIRFVENVFRKVSKKASRAVKSVLPVPISTRLVGFAVNGTIILTFLWVRRAFIEVFCTLGSAVFVSILLVLVRGIWYFQESRSYRADADEPQPWTRSQPAT